MTPGEYPDSTDDMKSMKETDGWITVYQRVKPNDRSSDDWSGTYPRWKPKISIGSGPEYYFNGVGSQKPADTTLLSNGQITLSFDVAKQGGKRDNRINEVRMDGVFNNPGKRNLKTEFVTSLDIIIDIMYKYASVPHDRQRYYFIDEKLSEIEDELSRLNNYEIGVLFDKAVSVYEAIEKLQGGSVLGFQFTVYQNKFTVRLDNPNREKRWDIQNTEILHLDEVEIDWNADLYGSYTDIEYAYNYDEKSGKHWIDKGKRKEILDIHRQEKDWSVKTLLANETAAKKKSDILLEDFSTLQPLIKNIQLSGEKWFNMRVYDIVQIDFNIPGEEREKYPRHLIRLIEEVGNGRLVTTGRETDEYVTLISDEKETIGQRNFVGNIVGELRCQILMKETDTQSGITTIDVRVKNESEHWTKPK